MLVAHPHALVVRTSACFSAWDETCFVGRALCDLAAGREVRCADDTTASPTYVPDLVHTALDLAIDGERGLWHLVNSGAVTAAQLVRLAARGCGISTASLAAVPQQALGGRARRPRNSALGSSRGMLLPPLEHALERYHQDLSQARGTR